MIRKIVVSALFFASAFFSSAQSSVRLGVLKGISCAPCAYLIENREKLAVQNMEFHVFDSVRSQLPKLLRGELDAGFLSPADAAKVFTAGNGAIVALGVAQNGNDFLLTSDESYKSLEDLRGKSIVCARKGSEQDFVLRHVLSKKKIEAGESEDENSVRLDFSIPAASIASKLISGEIKYALLGEPFAAVAQFYSPKIKRAENFQKLYSETEKSRIYPAMLLVARADFARENGDLLRRLIDVYKNALSWTAKNPSEAALLIEKHKLGLQSSVARKAIVGATLTWRDITEAKSDLEHLYSITNSKAPAEDFYFRR